MQARAQPAALAVPPSQLQPLSLWQKLVPLAVIFFCASFNLTLLANLKVATPSFMAIPLASGRPAKHSHVTGRSFPSSAHK